MNGCAVFNPVRPLVKSIVPVESECMYVCVCVCVCACVCDTCIKLHVHVYIYYVEIFANFANACHWRKFSSQNFSPSEKFASSHRVWVCVCVSVCVCVYVPVHEISPCVQ